MRLSHHQYVSGRVLNCLCLKVMDKFVAMPKIDGLLPLFFERGLSGRYGFGARGDSYYEYLLKQWLLTGVSPLLPTPKISSSDAFCLTESNSNWCSPLTAA